MEYSFSYDKKQVMQGLRRHFISRSEIRMLLILVNVFAITAAILYALKKIRPEPFLLGSCIWLFLMGAVWFLLPYTVYKRSATFQDRITAFFTNDTVLLETENGQVSWKWDQFTDHFESEGFFHLYLSKRSFFLIPKDEMPQSMRHELRGLLKQKIRK